MLFNDDYMKALKPSLLKNELELNVSKIPDEYKCFLCHNLICEAYVIKCCRINTCAICIELHTNKNNFCTNCESRITKKDVIFDPKLNYKIQILRVECPNSECYEEVEIKNLQSHLQMCEYGKCLFTSNTADDAMVRNIRRLQTEFKNSKITHESEMEHIGMLDSVIRKLGKEQELTAKFKEDMQDNYKEIWKTLSELKTEDKIMTYKIKSMDNKMTFHESSMSNRMTQLEEKLNHQEKVMQREKEDKELKYNELMRETKYLRSFSEQLVRDLEIVNTCLNKKDQELNALKVTLDSIGELRNNFKFSFSGMNDMKRGDDYYSNEFLLHGYLFKFHLVYRKNDIVHACVHICKSNQSDSGYATDWPLKHRIKLAVLDSNGAEIVKKLFQYYISQFKDQYCCPNEKSVQLSDSRIDKKRNNMIYNNNVCLKLSLE